MPLARTAAKPGGSRPGGWLENLRGLLLAALIAVGLRTLAFEPFNIPSGSMIPTLQVGDFLFITKYSYGYSRYSIPFSPPLFGGRLFGGTPNRGDVVVFKYPRDNSTDYIKRVIGLPGDRVAMHGGELYVNGAVVPRVDLGAYTTDDDGAPVQGEEYREALPEGPRHLILKLTADGWANNTGDYVVPPDHLFCMGDNRDNSQDSRFMDAVGFVPMENLLGRARVIFLSVDLRHPLWQIWRLPGEIRWSRFFRVIV